VGTQALARESGFVQPSRLRLGGRRRRSASLMVALTPILFPTIGGTRCDRGWLNFVCLFYSMPNYRRVSVLGFIRLYREKCRFLGFYP
jgi:O-antigen ligase